MMSDKDCKDFEKQIETMMKKAEKGERIYNGFRAIGIILIIIILGTIKLINLLS